MKKLTRLTAHCLLVAGLVAGLCLSACNPASNQHPQKPIVKTTYGSISGSFEDGVFSFKGIPYAKADRFMPPQAPDSWEGVREHTKFGPIAMQVNAWSPETAMNEQKLFTVNVWTRGINDGKKRPVMFWLHGGGFSVGASDDPITDGKMLAQKGDVVLVSVNHRLNILGFLDLSAYGAQYANSANVGMLDTVAALEWVNKNIRNFGGDPKNVTILGESGGGGKVGTLLSMPAAKGLFNKAIIQSGALLNVTTKEKSLQIGKALVETLGLNKDNINQINNIPYKQLVEAGNKALEKTVGLRTPGSITMVGFAPVPDGINLLQQPFTPDFADISNDIPLLIGTTLNELVKTAYAEKNLTLDEAKKRLTKTYGDKTDTYVKLFEKAYPNYTPQDLVSIDTLFRPNTIVTADARSAKTKAPVYTYLLTWKSDVDNNTKGSFHGLDIPLAFKNIELGKHWTGTSDEAKNLAEKMSSAWINFAKTGNPNDKSLPAWKPYSRENGETMIFDKEPKILNNHDRELMQLIKSVR
ncbi:carboxylic ester hydrolase [Cellvibrio zantedeschiae]|uniref:Carboxylic ester hydrolase n=1 Tax=Cellvibrio zantedeschiae TaxID=1237077 RepID=A0ABQ3B1Y7_9GAMM|nr:carboxylesterase family protein [Cellvibrio zantedeschiae]GGY75167.1 carboxylic ester hydrolase [Cellvibrio zantedeschiae]